jgi:hypothetical protein
MDANLTDSLVIEESALIKTELVDDADRPESLRGSASDNQGRPKHPGAVEPLGALAIDPTPSPKSIEEWAAALKMACRAKKKNIFRLARMFHAAKSSLQRHGEWTGLWKLKDKSERPPMSKHNGDRHALIGEVFGDVNETWPSHLADLSPQPNTISLKQ